MGQRYYYGGAKIVEEHGSKLFFDAGPWSVGLLKIENALCSDGVRRTAHCTGMADSYFSRPACVKVRGKTVSGFISSRTVQRLTAAPWLLESWCFTANGSSRNAIMLPTWPCIWCQNTGDMQITEPNGNPDESKPCFDCAKKEEH